VALHRAVSLLEIKSVDEEKRIIRGIASTPEPDRLGDVLDPKGATFALPMPLLWQHRAAEPIGSVTAAKVTKAGIEIIAEIAKIGIARIDEAWTLVKSGLVRGLSVGFRPLAPPEFLEDADGEITGFKFGSWEWVELSAVTIPANSGAAILSVKSLRDIDASDLAASRELARAPGQVISRGASRARAIRLIESRGAAMKKTYGEQIRDWENTRRTKEDERAAILEKFEAAGELPDDAAGEQLEALEAEIKKISAHIVRLQALESDQAASAKAIAPASVTDPAAASRARDAAIAPASSSSIQVRANLPLGQEFVRAAICKLKSFMDHGAISPVAYAKAMYPDCPRIVQYLERAAVPAANTIDQTWAGALVVPSSLATEFLAFVRPSTIIGKFGTGNVPSLRRVPFNTRIGSQTAGGSGYWVGQGAAKPLTKAGFGSQTLLWTKIAAISVLTDELARFSSPSAELLIREDLRDAVVARLDTDFVDPAKAAVAAVSPASVTNGVTPLVSAAGVTADSIRADLAAIIGAYIKTNQNLAGLVLIMPESLAMQVGLLRNPLGQAEFPGIGATGGTLEGIPVITSQYAMHGAAPGAAMVIAVNARYVLLADDDQVTIDASREASLEMSDAPTANSVTNTAPTVAMVSMFQTNSIALRAERYVNWAKANANAVVWMDNVDWGSPTGS